MTTTKFHERWGVIIFIRRICVSAIVVGGMSMFPGCESTAGKEGGSIQDRQDAAVKNPWSYGPESHDPKKAPTGRAKEHPGDASAKEEWDRFWNP